MQLALLDRDLTWLEGAPVAVAARVAAEWRVRLVELAPSAVTPMEREALAAARRRIAENA